MVGIENLETCFLEEDDDDVLNPYTVQCTSMVLNQLSEHDLKTNVVNNVLVRSFPFFARVEYCNVETNEVFLSRYHTTLQDVLNKDKYAIFSQSGDATKYGVVIIAKLFNAFSILYQKGISYLDSSLENVVFLNSDTRCMTPHLSTLFFTDTSKKEITFKTLGVLIRSTSQSKTKLAFWWEEFIRVLHAAHLPMLQRHPVFWRTWDTKDFILRVRDIVKEKKERSFTPAFKSWFRGQPECMQWTADIQKDKKLKDFYADSVKLYKARYKDDPRSLVKLLRNLFTHYNDKAVNAHYLAIQGGGMGASTSSAQTCDVSGLEEHVWSKYHRFMMYLFNAMWEDVINDGIQKGFEWSPHSEMRGSEVLFPC